MFKLTAVSHLSSSANPLLQSQGNNPGYLLITQQDKIVYANSQARHFLGLLLDEELPLRQTFLSLAASMYQCSPDNAWAGWPHPSSANNIRYLNYSPRNGRPSFRLKIEILEQLIIDALPIWIVSMVATESLETAVTQPINN